MCLTAQQLQQFNNLIPQLSAKQIIQMMTQHNVAIDQLPALQKPENAEKLAAIKQVLEAEKLEIQQAKHEADWKALLSRLADPAQSLQAMQMLQQFIDAWQTADLNPSHVAEARQKQQEVKQQEHEADWQRTFQLATGTSQPEQAMQALRQFIDKWQSVSLPFSHVDEARQQLEVLKRQMQGIYAQQEEAEWQQLIYRQTVGDIPAYAEHVNKWRAYGIETHASEADDKAWDIVQHAPDVMKAMQDYVRVFPQGRHVADAQSGQNAYFEWLNVKGTNDLIQVQNYLTNHPTSPFSLEARQLLDSLKTAEIERMQEEKDQFSVDRLNKLLYYGIFTESQLIGAGVATESSIDKIRDLSWKEVLPKLEQVSDECKTYCADGRTDIYLFGTPSTGKTCVLMGLLKSSRIQPDNVASAGKYVDALNLYCEYGCVPGATKENFVATIQADIQVKGQKHEINLVELAGEDFVTKIATRREDTIAYEDMGKGVPELLANDNRKVFFFIVDPTSKTVRVKKNVMQRDANGKPLLDEFGQPITQSVEYTVHQSNSLKAMANMLKNEANRKVMERVDAIHIIVTKADMLGDEYEREEKAEKLIRKRYSDTVAILTDICRHYGINQHPDKRLNGVPHLFTFSLGQFMPGGFEYDPTDSNVLVDTIAKCTQSRRGLSLWDRFCQAISKPVM